MLNEIIRDLSENFNEGDEQILSDYIDEVTTDALSISNREMNSKNINLLKSEIKKCVKSLYLQRGGEGTTSLNASGVSSSFIDAKEVLRKDIVNSGKRVPFI